MKKLNDKVRHCLQNYPQTRGDDGKLIEAVYWAFYGIDPRNVSFDSIIKKMTDGKLPGFESIRRCRQKIQEHDESLRADKATEDMRLARQKEVLDYVQTV